MRRYSAAVCAICLSILAVSLSSAAPTDKKKGAKPTAPAAAAASAATGASVDPKSFVIGAEDVLMVSVWRDPEVSRQVMVRPDGKITLQLVGDIQAAGLTPEALTQVIFDGLSKLKTIDKSEVTVSIMTVNSRKYYLQGEVNRPGVYTLLVPTTVLEAIGQAGGFREFANQKNIVIIR